MRINKKILLGICTLLIALSILPTNGACQTTIGNSTFAVEEGETYTWVCTYSHPNISSILTVGSYQNVTIDRIYQGPFDVMSNTLIVEATLGYFNKTNNTHVIESAPYWIVYNFTLSYIYYQYFIDIYIVPIPLNLTMICEYIESLTSQTCYSVGNQIFLEFLNNTIECKFNSDGILTKVIIYMDDIKYATIELERSAKLQISFGHYYILISIIAMVAITIIVKKRNRIRHFSVEI